MFSVTILASSSAGNCALLRVGQKKYLVDAGLSARQIALRLATCGVNFQELDGAFITHEHIDHVMGLPVLLKKHPMPLYCNSQTGSALRREALPDFKNWHFFQTGHQFSIGDLTVESFHVPHDAVDPVGFAFHAGSHTIGFLTDLGHATSLAIERVRDAQILVLESNHDEKLLQDCPKRPWSLKQRILSRHGHLSNAAAAEVALQLLERNLEQLILGHLSQDCNTPEIAHRTMQNRLSSVGADHIAIHCASPREVSGSFAAGAGPHGQGADEVNPVQSSEQQHAHANYVDQLFREFAEADPM